MEKRARGRPPKPPSELRERPWKVFLTDAEEALWREAFVHDRRGSMSDWVRWVVGLHIDYEVARGWRPQGDLAVEELTRRKKAS